MKALKRGLVPSRRQRGFFGPAGLPSPLSMGAVTFDGTDQIFRSSASSISNSKLLTLVMWTRQTGTAGMYFGHFSAVDGSIRFNLRRFSGGFQVIGRSAANVNILEILTAGGMAGDAWTPVLFSVDMGNTANRHIYAGDRDLLASVTVYTNAELGLADDHLDLAGDPVGSQRYSGDIGSVWYAPGVYIDFSVEANRRKFVTSDGRPVFLGKNGEKPTGTQPAVYFHINKNETETNFGVNKGTAGAFTTLGTLAKATSNPLQQPLPASYPVAAADFNAATTLERGGGLTGAADSKTGIISAWVRHDATTAFQRILAGSSTLGGADDRFSLSLAAGRFEVRGFNSAGTAILLLRTLSTLYGSSAQIANGAWNHVLCSWDLSLGAASGAHVYINGGLDESVSLFTNDTLDYTVADWSIAGDPDGTSFLDGALAELYFAPGQYLDFSLASNRLKFINQARRPVFLGADGSLPTGVAPLMYHRVATGGAGGDFVTNLGTGGAFTVSGTTPALASTSPS